MYNLTVGLKSKNNTPIDECDIKYLRRILCHLLGEEKNKVTNHINCKHNNVNDIKLFYKEEVTVLPTTEANCIVKENFITYKDELKVFINCNSYEGMNRLVQGLYKLDLIEVSESEFQISEIELKISSNINEDAKVTKIAKGYTNKYSENLNNKEILELVHSM